MTDIVLPLGKGSIWQNQEIKYSLRSVEKYLSGVRDIYIIGEEVPSFLKDVRQIHMLDIHVSKETNIYDKIIRACQETNISEDFLFFNDDHFLLSEFEASTFPFFCNGHLRSMVDRNKKGNYYKAVCNTYRTLIGRNLPTVHFDLHCPILYNKQKFITEMRNYDWSNRISFIIKSLYGNSIQIQSTDRESDCKINKPCLSQEILDIIKNRKFFSIGNLAINEQLKITMEQLYPNSSRWEK